MNMYPWKRVVVGFKGGKSMWRLETQFREAEISLLKTRANWDVCFGVGPGRGVENPAPKNRPMGTPGESDLFGSVRVQLHLDHK